MEIREPQTKIVPGDRVMLSARFVRESGGSLYSVARMRGTILSRAAHGMDLLPSWYVVVKWDDAEGAQRINRGVLWPAGKAE